jgi:two-component system OmpR family response regulator
MTRCLVVDDDPELLQSVCDYLRRFGLEPSPAASAAGMRAPPSRKAASTSWCST